MSLLFLPVPFMSDKLRVLKASSFFFRCSLFFVYQVKQEFNSSIMPATTTVQPSVTAHVHPLVLLSATDHYNRVAKDTKKRVIGVLLGQNKGKTVNVSNSFAGN